MQTKLMTNKKVLIDSRWAGDTGIGRLYKEVMNRKPMGLDCEYIPEGMGLGSPLSPLGLGSAARKSSAEVFYSPSFMPPFAPKMPFIFTVHDLMHLFYYSKMHQLYYKTVISWLSRRAKKIITVSHYSKGQLVELMGIPEQLIEVIYNGVDDSFLENKEAKNLGRPYFLYVGNRRVNKNLPNMLRAFATASLPEDFIFALSGKSDPELDALIRDLGIGDRVKFLGFIPEAELPAYYRGAFATMFVSLMEGFGLPVLESMASETPVITSTVSSLPEIAGGAAACVAPDSPEAIATAMSKLVDDSRFYADLQQKGLVQARKFPWEKTAQSTWNEILS